ncbi:Cell surface A33 antigen [Oryzias melastigma]|uniref:Cell surface A33 antigen n=1 Tax=Oryzias melastigma TaxID=30732 RepID=A0A834CSJ9_ORYME|nr:Cell surface A33 antigen [Oryzias melastigma]
MESSMLTFVLLCVVWSNVAAIEVKIPEQVYEAVNGSDTTIPCKFETSVENPQSGVISWFRRDLNSSARNELILTYYYPDKIFDVAENVDAKGFSIDADLLNGKADLIIKNVEMEDNMIFECRVQIRGDIDGTNSNSATLVVLVAPSTPICEVQGNPKNGEDIKLTCVSNEASPPAEYKWQSLDAQNNPRDPEPKSTDNGGVLSLFGITTDTSGTYTCTSSNRVGSASCSLTLSVTP